MKATLLRASLAAVIGQSLLAQVPPTLATAIEDVLPASTYAAVRFGGLAACSEAAGLLPMAAAVGAFLQRLPADVRAEHLDRGLDEAARTLHQALGPFGVSAADLRALARQPMALALGRLSIEGMGPSVALVVELGQSGDAVRRCASAAEAMLLEAEAAVAVGSIEVGGVTVREVRFHGGPAVFAGAVGGCFVVTNSRGYLRDMTAVVAGTKPGLAAASRLPQLRGRLPAPALASVFLHTSSFAAMLDAHLPYEAEEFGSALGVGQLDAIYAGATATRDGGTDVLHVGLHGSERGLLKSLLAQPADLAFAGFCSKNTVVFAAGSLDAPAVIDAFQRFTGLLPAEAREGLHDGVVRDLQRWLRRGGTSPEAVEGLLHAFGTQVGLALGLEKGAVPKPELLLRIAVRDAAAVATFLGRMEEAAAREGAIEWKSRRVGDHEIRFCSLELPAASLQLSPCYALTESGLLCASDVAALMRALRQAENPDESLVAQDDFKALARDLSGGSGVLHLRLFRAAELGWRTAESWVYPQLDAHKDEVGFGSEVLPDQQAMTEALGTTTFVYHVDDDGLTLRSHGTATFGALLAALGMLGDEVLGRASGRVY